jgi:hypothetical protein
MKNDVSMVFQWWFNGVSMVFNMVFDDDDD